VREAAQYAPAPVRRTLRPSSSPYTPHACGAQRALLPVAVGAMNIHVVRDRQTSDRHHFIFYIIMPPVLGHNNVILYSLSRNAISRFVAVASQYGVRSVMQSKGVIKSVVWMLFVETLSL